MANGKAAAIDKEWEEMKKQISSVTSLFGWLLFVPVMFLVGIAYGIKTGIIAGAEKTLELMKAWGE
uniref:Uncharacterized protein n=1 Tax=viral metagenome TaxID=1070528 RepID=A0A6H1ZVJ5_9ZZZZ